MKVAAFVPVSEEMLKDAAVPSLGVYLRYLVMRRLTVDLFGEDWFSADTEMERMELGQAMHWDWFPDEDED